MFKCQFQSELGSSFAFSHILKLEEQAYFGWLDSGPFMTSLRSNQSAFRVGLVVL